MSSSRVASRNAAGVRSVIDTQGSPQGFSAYRFVIESTFTGVEAQVREIALIDEFGAIQVGGTPGASSEHPPAGFSTWLASHAFENPDLGRLWRADVVANDPFPSVIGMVFPGSIVLSEYAIQRSGGGTADPLVWEFQGSNDASTVLDGTWTVLDRQDPASWGLLTVLNIPITQIKPVRTLALPGNKSIRGAL